MSQGNGQGRKVHHLGRNAGDLSWQARKDPPACMVPTDLPIDQQTELHRRFDAGGPGRLTEATWTRIRAAIAVCHGCPIRDACLTYALDPEHRVEGVWGGFYFSAVEARSRSLTGERLPALPPPPPRRPRRRAPAA